MKVIVGTKNKKKVSAATRIFQEVLAPTDLEVMSYDAKSGVPEAPFNDETYRGALSRAKDCSNLAADYFVGIESGLVERYGHLFEEAWAVVISKDNKTFLGYSSGLLIPSVVAKRMRAGEKHNDIMKHYDQLFDLPDDNRDTWSRYTGGNISRQISLDEALRNSIIQLMPSDRNLYKRPWPVWGAKP